MTDTKRMPARPLHWPPESEPEPAPIQPAHEQPTARRPRTPRSIHEREQARKLIVERGIGVKSTADTLGIPIRTVQTWCEEGQWVSSASQVARKRVKRSAASVAKSVADGVVRNVARVVQGKLDALMPQITDYAAKTLLKSAQTGAQLQDKVAMQVAQPEIKPEMLESLSRTWERIDTVSRRTLGLDQPNALNSSPIRINVLGSVRIDEDLTSNDNG